ncbi:GerMN domain-containing protein [Anaerosoma tenue]|uniref:GerMN domain-containing protein n=1 Tax=Anaerosoma tenue TaxID=2933588 RepID=UPI002260EB9F|nr:GerMN domain-containing protein [Anaerosoma tenue]MCK8115132.1 GerMN domain-containing protein [Anaerosoma tenue]
MRSLRWISIAVVIAMALSLPMLAGCSDDADTDTTPPATNGDSPADDQDGTPVDDGSTEPDEAPADDGASGEDSGNDEADTPETLTVRLYWVSAGENALGIERTLPYTKAIGTAAIEALLDGPTDAEQGTWPAISSAIPEGTQLLGLTIDDGIAKIDLSEEFESGGGTFGVTARLAQVVYTLDQFPTVDAVEFYIEGTKVTVFSSEGVMLYGPQTLDDYDQLLPIDA